jgi:hypothetical protein
MRAVRLGLTLFGVVLALVSTGGALAARGDPQKRITPADQARAKSMLLRRADLSAGFTSTSPGNEPVPYCKALDESDPTLTCEAESADFAQPATATVVSSAAQVYRSLRDANTSWRRGTSVAGVRCVEQTLRRELLKGGIRDVQLTRQAFPRVAQRSVAFRVVGVAQGIPVFFDVVLVQQSRAHVSLLFGAALQPVLKAEQVRLARLVGTRMAKAMRGG